MEFESHIYSVPFASIIIFDGFVNVARVVLVFDVSIFIIVFPSHIYILPAVSSTTLVGEDRLDTSVVTTPSGVILRILLFALSVTIKLLLASKIILHGSLNITFDPDPSINPAEPFPANVDTLHWMAVVVGGAVVVCGPVVVLGPVVV
jgi:hypothetical protein